MQFCHFWAVTYLCQTFIKKYLAIPFPWWRFHCMSFFHFLNGLPNLYKTNSRCFRHPFYHFCFGERFILLSKFGVDIMYHYFLTTTNWLSPGFFLQQNQVVVLPLCYTKMLKSCTNKRHFNFVHENLTVTQKL
jgi:hypothetical protein